MFENERRQRSHWGYVHFIHCARAIHCIFKENLSTNQAKMNAYFKDMEYRVTLCMCEAFLVMAAMR